MSGSRPPRPVGSNREAQFQQWVYDSISQLKINDSRHIKVKRTTKGVHLEIDSKTVIPAADSTTTIVPRWG